MPRRLNQPASPSIMLAPFSTSSWQPSLAATHQQSPWLRACKSAFLIHVTEQDGRKYTATCSPEAAHCKRHI